MTRINIRYMGATAALLMAGIYYLIGLGVLNVGNSTTGDSADLGVFGFGAGSAFVVVAALLALTDRRWINALSLLFQLLVFITYIGVSGSRSPSFEVWGLTLRLLQVVVIACLTYLTFAKPRRAQVESHA